MNVIMIELWLWYCKYFERLFLNCWYNGLGVIVNVLFWLN